jgi:hypothetical protein
MTAIKIELAPLTRPVNTLRGSTPADRAYAEAGRALFGVCGMSLVLFPERELEL